MDIAKHIKSLLKKKAFKNIGFLTIGNIISQVIALIGALYIPKLLGPDNYGVFNTVSAYIGLFTVFTITGLNKVIIREISSDLSLSKKVLETVIGARNLFSLLAAVLSLIIVLFINYEIGTKYYILIFSFSLLYTGLQNSITAIFQSHQEMKILAYIAILKQVIRVPLAILFLYLGYGVLSLILIQIFIQIIALIITYYYSRKYVLFDIFSPIRLVKHYINPGIKFSIIEFLNVLNSRVDIVILSLVANPYTVGIYSFSYRLIEKGTILRGPISQSIFPYYSNKFNKAKPRLSQIAKHTLIIAVVILIFIVPAFFLINPLIHYFFEGEYNESIVIFQILLLYMLFNFLIVPWSLTLQATSKENNLLKISAFTVLLVIPLSLGFFDLFGAKGIAIAKLTTTTLKFILLVIITYFSIKGTKKRI